MMHSYEYVNLIIPMVCCRRIGYSYRHIIYNLHMASVIYFNRARLF